MFGNGLEAAKDNIKDGWGLRRAMGECSSQLQPPDLSLDQLERVRDSGGGNMGQRRERREILSQETGREFLQPTLRQRVGGFGFSCTCVRGGGGECRGREMKLSDLGS